MACLTVRDTIRKGRHRCISVVRSSVRASRKRGGRPAVAAEVLRRGQAITIGAFHQPAWSAQRAHGVQCDPVLQPSCYMPLAAQGVFISAGTSEMPVNGLHPLLRETPHKATPRRLYRAPAGCCRGRVGLQPGFAPTKMERASCQHIKDQPQRSVTSDIPRWCSCGHRGGSRNRAYRS